MKHYKAIASALIVCIFGTASLSIADEVDEVLLPEFQETYGHLQKAIKSGASYDIEQTIKVMNGMERALQSSDNLDDYLHSLARMNLSNVAPDMLKNKLSLLGILAEMRRLEHEEADFKCTSKFILGLRITQNHVDASSTEAKTASVAEKNNFF